jgi:murein L,D-transpeptidase YcbB/YkuD
LETLVKSAGFDRVLVSIAFGLVLVLSNHPGMAQRIGQQNIDTAVPIPEASLRPSLTTNDVADIARQAPPAEPGTEPKQETAAPASEPAPPEPVDSGGVAVSIPETTLAPPLTAKDFASSPGAAPAETAKAAQKQETAPGADSATADSAVSQQQIGAAVPMPETTLPPPLTAKDIASSPNAAPAETAKTAQKQETAPGADPATADSAVSQQPIGTAVPMPETTLPPPLTAKDIANSPNASPAETAKAAPKQDAATPASATADGAVADQLHDMIANKLDRIVKRKADREGVESFYKARNYAPLWVSNGDADSRAKAAIAYLAQVDSVGLDPNDYPIPDFKSVVTAETLAQDELKLTASVLSYARQAQIGRIHFSRVGTDIQFNLVAPEPAKVLAELADGNDAGKVLDGFNPPQPEFKALSAKLAKLRKRPAASDTKAEDKPEPPRVHVPDGKILRPGMKDARVVSLRKRLDIAGDKDNPLYDDEVRDAVKTFQTESEIAVDGNLDLNTVRTLNGEKKVAHGPSADLINTIIVNMERWRWMPRNLGNPHVIVNVPDYTLTLYNDGKPYWHTKIVAGKPGKATPMVSADMKFITVNPTWNVPPSIIENEYLPALQVDPQALDRVGLKITQDQDGTIHVWQPPGAGNALGRIRFNFPNKFLVYQHDTPDKYLFARQKRSYSHGCMRVQNPLTYGEKLLSLVLPNEHYTEARLEEMFGGSEININFPKFIPVHLTYQTAFVDDHGKLQLREDVYGRDARMIAILKGSERKVADIAIERHPNTSSKPVRMPVGLYGDRGYYSGPRYSGGGYSGPSFLDFFSR